ncbi:MAG: CBS domain-containing protein [Actinomycetota bacterium]|nr:CBS domain-containing protein [Actinomycetota bacterium]
MEDRGSMEVVVKVSDVMTKDVLSIGPADRLRRAATVMRERRVGGLPVVDGDKVVGMITESDFLNIAADTPDGERHGFLDALFGGHRAANPSTLVGEAMTKDPIIVTDSMTIREAARTMKRHKIKRVPVVGDDGRLVGILSRADVMKVFAREDDAIAADVADILHRYRFDHQVEATTNDGRIMITGGVEHRSGAKLIEEILFRILGVIEVDNQITWVYDDSGEK